jgi:hypothetical protein
MEPRVGAAIAATTRGVVGVGPRSSARLSPMTCSGSAANALRGRSIVTSEAKSFASRQPIATHDSAAFEVRTGTGAITTSLSDAGRVVDLATGHRGLSIAEYQALWQYPDTIHFGF